MQGITLQVKESREGGRSRVHKLNRNGLTFGRSPDADVVILVRASEYYQHGYEYLLGNVEIVLVLPSS